MVDGWAGLMGTLFRLIPLLIYHFRGLLLVRTPADLIHAMSVQGMFYAQTLPQCLLYILLGFVYSVISPCLLPFLIVFFALGYTVYRHQFINVYEAQYDSAASFWPLVHNRIVAALVLEQVILIGCFAVKNATVAGACLIPLPILTLIWHFVFCKGPYENAFRLFSLEEALKKDTVDGAQEDLLQSRNEFLDDAYLHPAVARAMDRENAEELGLLKIKSRHSGPRLIPLKRYPGGGTIPPVRGSTVESTHEEEDAEGGDRIVGPPVLIERGGGSSGNREGDCVEEHLGGGPSGEHNVESSFVVVDLSAIEPSTDTATLRTSVVT
eukprot:TRINITY_DN21220_c0_g2_i1.p1 TRINITY_DN21220_c0_g2~~TRINITY_DN21220_c0_g2_i1.p1  ORF type:complete len:363 (-),score=69.25 TRINITY_DN21220_c0_g2_i1:75-1046(-)